MCSFGSSDWAKTTDEIFEFFQRFQKAVDFETSRVKNIKRDPFLLIILVFLVAGPP